MATVLERVGKVVVDRLGAEESAVVAEASFVADLNADSLDLVALLLGQEETLRLDLVSVGKGRFEGVLLAVVHAGLGREAENGDQCERETRESRRAAEATAALR